MYTFIKKQILNVVARLVMIKRSVLLDKENKENHVPILNYMTHIPETGCLRELCQPIKIRG